MSPPGFAIRVAAPLLVVLVVLASASAFATRQAHTESPRVAPDTAARAMARSVVSALPGASSMPATPQYSGSDGPSLSNDADNEEGGTGGPLGVFAVVGFWVLLSLLSRQGRLLSASCEGPAKLSSVSCSILERPD
jgi:hypothetical protein